MVLEFAIPLLEGLGPSPAIDDARAAVALAVTFWNASVLASKRWEYPRVKELNELKKRMRGRQASCDDAATFDLLAARWREYWLDPRLGESWAYDADASGVPRLLCAMALPDGARAEIPPPAEKRVAIGGKFLDEVQIRQSATSYLSFPVGHHRGVIGDDIAPCSRMNNCPTDCWTIALGPQAGAPEQDSRPEGFCRQWRVPRGRRTFVAVMPSNELHADLHGWWRIVETSQWGNDGLDVLGPALISITGYGDRLRMHSLLAYLNTKPTKTGASFTWKGAWEYDPMSGTGSVRLGKDGKLHGRIKIKGGDESTFLAESAPEPAEPIPPPPSYRDKWRRRW